MTFPPGYRTNVPDEVAHPNEARPSFPGESIGHLQAAFSEYVRLPDYDVVTVTAAAAVTAHMPGDPTWLLVVSPASTSKTETIRVFDDVVEERVDDITIGGLLAWKPGKKRGEQEPTGILARHSGNMFASIGDLSTLLASSDRGHRDAVFSLLRRAYDGSVHRDLAAGPLRWQGRLTLLAAVTPSVDNYSSHADSLGPRWLYYRLPTLNGADRRASSRAARENQGRVGEYRDAIQPLAVRVVAAAVERLAHVAVSYELGEAVDDYAAVACLGRASVERSGYGRKEITSPASIEGPARIAGQLHRLAHALLSLGLSDDEAARLCRRVALDSMPLKRRGVLAALASGEELPVAVVARMTGFHRHVVRFALEELETIGVAAYDATSEEGFDDDSTRTRRPWKLDGDDAALIARVFGEQEVARKVASPTTSPPIYTSTPHFVPPSTPHEQRDSAGGAS